MASPCREVFANDDDALPHACALPVGHPGPHLDLTALGAAFLALVQACEAARALLEFHAPNARQLEEAALAGREEVATIDASGPEGDLQELLATVCAALKLAQGAGTL